MSENTSEGTVSKAVSRRKFLKMIVAGTVGSTGALSILEAISVFAGRRYERDIWPKNELFNSLKKIYSDTKTDPRYYLEQVPNVIELMYNSNSSLPKLKSVDLRLVWAKLNVPLDDLVFVKYNSLSGLIANSIRPGKPQGHFTELPEMQNEMDSISKKTKNPFSSLELGLAEEFVAEGVPEIIEKKVKGLGIPLPGNKYISHRTDLKLDFLSVSEKIHKGKEAAMKRLITDYFVINNHKTQVGRQVVEWFDSEGKLIGTEQFLFGYIGQHTLTKKEGLSDLYVEVSDFYHKQAKQKETVND